MSDTTTDPTPNQNPDASTGLLAQLVGPGKKFADEEALAKGKFEADAFIQKLIGENKDLKGIVTTQETRLARMEARLSILDRLGDSSSDVDEPSTTTSTQTSQTATPPAGLSEADTLRLIEQHELDKQRKANVAYVDNVLAKALGTEAVAFMRQRASELGVAPELFQQMAGSSPKALLSMLGLNPEGKNQSNPMYTAGANGKAPTPGTSPVRNRSFYEKQKAEMGATKFAFDTKLQIQMHKDMQTLGDAFDS